ncbi:putative acetyltransferase domain-containing protein [Neospora caninum Liverpool]|uniref:Acetyltransferase domain-containing protein,putative n=1 Tax=Neospora caninum (strain Liverpool) TaxID=572307 RepID=F0VE98_NEOCL|nr:putative acetyltransferase domain-containing protein [Neospora caninum Liverpool]CBZ52042.1 putative acetyltransferase domain-containing protein [Neospora caninum Liverpool]CEL66003.1 TPA: acetyltransferase domain-containing protein,putative [Neospora caninum Liverpool]|eukprot:XP_003882074.1 putative acetyltransferase domain-containing protein [Neospora caninum Liverpool]
MSTCVCNCTCCKQPDRRTGACCALDKKCDCSCRCCQTSSKCSQPGSDRASFTRIVEHTLLASSEEPVTKVTQERVVIEGDDGKTVTSTETECRTMFAPSSSEPEKVSSDVTITSGEAGGAEQKSSGKCKCVCCSDSSCACTCTCCKERSPTGRCCRTGEGQTKTGDKGCKKCMCCSASKGACACPCACCAPCTCSCACCKDKKKCSCCSDGDQGRCGCSCACCKKTECQCCKCCTKTCPCECQCCRVSRDKTGACGCDCACCAKSGAVTGGSCCASKKSQAQKGAMMRGGERGREERLGTARHRERTPKDEERSGDPVRKAASSYREKMCEMMAGADDAVSPCPYFSSVPRDFVKILTCKTGEQVILRRMELSDYPAVRVLLPSVSRCPTTLSDAQVASILSLPVFYAWCCFSVKNAESEGGDEREREGDLLGYCEVLLQPHLGRKPDGRLERVVVSERFRGRGLATKMCEAVVQEVRERDLCGRLDLTVEKLEARHIYENKLGFKAVDTSVLRLEF